MNSGTKSAPLQPYALWGTPLWPSHTQMASPVHGPGIEVLRQTQRWHMKSCMLAYWICAVPRRSTRGTTNKNPASTLSAKECTCLFLSGQSSRSIIAIDRHIVARLTVKVGACGCRPSAEARSASRKTRDASGFGVQRDMPSRISSIFFRA